MSTPPDEIWKCQDGRLVAVGDMTEAHAKNALRMILRNRREQRARQVDLDRLQEELLAEIAEDRKWGSD
jgi:septum formation topological specificity factor MinE